MRSALVCLLVLSTLAVQAQRSQGNNSAKGLPLSDRLYFGGGGGFGGGRDFNGFRYTSISVSPLAGYRITLPWSAGVMVNYNYVRYPDIDLTLQQYGISPFTRYQFGKLFAYGEYSMISAPTFDNSARRWFNRLPVGLGYSIPIGQRAALNAMALYDLLYDRRDGVFASPWVIRVFVSAGAISL